MSRRVKKKSDRSGRRKKPHSTRKKRKYSLSSAIRDILLKTLTTVALTALTGSILIFLFSTLAPWLFNDESEQPGIQNVTIEVLNGCGQDGAAKELTSILRKRGYQVMDFRNADRFDYENTRIVVRRGNLEEGKKVAVTIGCEEVVYKPSNEARADMSIILGEDWREMKVVSGKKSTKDQIGIILDFFNKFNYFD